MSKSDYLCILLQGQEIELVILRNIPFRNMATVDRACVPSSCDCQLQQNIPFRSRSPSSPMVLSRPTTSRRKCQTSTSPPKQQVVMRGSATNQQYLLGSATIKQRPIHSMYSASQPHLNAEEFDVQYRSRSHTVSTFDRRNRWSTAGIGEDPNNDFNSGSIGGSYDPRLTKCSVEDLRPLPIPVVAPKVPPRRGSRLTTVPNQNYRENVKVEANNKKYRETRSCEDLLESVSTAQLKAVKADIPKPNGQSNTESHHTGFGTAMIQDRTQHHQIPYQIAYHDNLTQPQASLKMGSSTRDVREAQLGQSSRQEKDTLQAMPVASTYYSGVSYPIEMENMQVVSNKSREPCVTSSQWTPTEDQRNAEFVGHQVANGNKYYTFEQSQQLQLNTQINTHVASGYQSNKSVAAPQSSLSTEYIYTTHYGSVPDSAYSSDTGVSSTVSQQSSPLPPTNMVSDALRMTPHSCEGGTSCSSPSSSPQACEDNNEIVFKSIPQSYNPNQDNNVKTTHIPHYAIPTNLSNGHKQEQTTPTNTDLVQSLTVVQGGPHSYRPGPDQPLTTPSNSEFYQSQPQNPRSMRQSQAAMAHEGVSTHTSLSQPTEANLCDTRKHEGSVVNADSKSQGVSQKTQAIAQAFNQWQYHDTAKRKQVLSKQNVHSQSKPPVKPKPARLIKGGSASLKRDKKKSQKSAEGSTETKKSGQKYVFKQSQSRTLLVHGRTPSQVDPLTDVGLEIQYGGYTPHKYHQSSSGSSSDSTLRDELRFTESQKEFACSGPSPNSYDYGSQMTLTGDATLTPNYYPSNGFHSPPTVYHGHKDALANPSTHRTSGTNAIQTHTSTTHFANNSYSQLPLTAGSQNQTLTCSSTSSSDFKPTSPLAPIAEVNIESEQSNSNLLNATEETDSTHNTRLDDGNLTKSSHFDNASTPQMSDGGSPQINDTHEGDDKPNPTVQRSSTLPSAYKRPTPYRFNTTKYVSVDIQEQDNETTDKNTFSSSSMKLSDFTALNTSVFPKHVKISNPLNTCMMGDIKLSQGDLLDLHFVRQTKAVVLVSAKGEEYVVPLNSANRFALIYDPLNTGQLMHQGYYFKSVGELIAMRQMPTVVIATEGYSGPKPQSSVEAGEILVISGVVKQAHGMALKVNSITHGRKLLEERCTANFSTRGEDTKLSLHDMFKASMQMPLQALMFPPSGLQLPEYLLDAPVTLKQFCVLKSVIATPSFSQHSTASIPHMVYDINLNLGIEIQECSEVIDKQLIEMRAKTQQLYSSFEPTKIIPFYNSKLESKEQLTTQIALFTNIDLKGKFLGMQLELPEWLGQIRISKAKQAVVQLQRGSLSQPLLSHDDPELGSPHYFKGGATATPFQPVNSTPTTTTEQRMVAMEKQCRRMDNKLNTLVRSFTEVVKQVSAMKMQQRQQQTDSETYHGHDQYVDMIQTVEYPSEPVSSNLDSHTLSSHDNQCDVEQETQQTEQHDMINNKHFEGVKEWQKKQEKHLQWQQEQVQQWQIECEKQMQVMQDKLTWLEDRQMKFFLETQRKVKQWKAEQEIKEAGKTAEPLQVKQESKDREIQELGMQISKKPQLPPKPTAQQVKNDTAIAVAQTTQNDGKQGGTGEKEVNSEGADFGLDMIADNIASWCSQMELELNELYSNSVESNQ